MRLSNRFRSAGRKRKIKRKNKEAFDSSHIPLPASRSSLPFSLMKRSRSFLTLGLALVALPVLSHAHRIWILPSTTVLSGENQWISVEAAVSNNLFFPNHRPVRLDSIAVSDPEGNPVELQNAISGEIRSSFELQ